MVKKQMKDNIKKELESLGQHAGRRIGQALSGKPDTRGADIGKKAGQVLAEQIERVHGAIEKESVSNEEQLGIGGKIGTGLGIIGKHVFEKRYGLLGRLMGGSTDFVSEGRAMGAKAEKLVKKAVKTGIQRVSGEKPKKNKGAND